MMVVQDNNGGQTILNLQIASPCFIHLGTSQVKEDSPELLLEPKLYPIRQSEAGV